MQLSKKASPLLSLATLAALGLAGAGPRAAQAQGYNFITFNYPNATDTRARGLSNNGQIVGRYGIGATTSGFSINVGAIPSNGFTSYTTGDAFSEIDAINDAGLMTGDYVKTSDSSNPGFLLSGSTHTDFNPGGTLTIPAGINKSGSVSGTAFDTNYIAQGFVRASDGTVTFFNDPKADTQGTFGNGINDAGILVGDYFNSGGFNTAFVDKNGTFTDVTTFPAIDSTIAYEINNLGDIVGSYQTPGATGFNPSQGFLLLANGTLLTLNVPGAISTEIFGVNDSRQVVGDYTDALGNYHGFFATAAPEPAGWVALGLGAFGLSALAFRARRKCPGFIGAEASARAERVASHETAVRV